MTKYCTLPGQTPVRLASTDGSVIIIGETPRLIPAQFVLEAKAAGCLTERELGELIGRLMGGAPAVKTESNEEESLDIEPQVATDTAAGDDTWPLDNTVPAKDVPADPRFEQIKSACIDLINGGNPADFNGAGVPKVEALRDKLGFNVTAAERDAGFEAAKG